MSSNRCGLCRRCGHRDAACPTASPALSAVLSAVVRPSAASTGPARQRHRPKAHRTPCVRCGLRERAPGGRRLCAVCLTGDGKTLDELIAEQAEDMRHGDRLGVLDRERFGPTPALRQWVASLDAMTSDGLDGYAPVDRIAAGVSEWDDPTFDEVWRRAAA